MPELPDVAAYISALEPRIVGQPLEHARIASVFVLRTADPPVAELEGRLVRELRRVGKRIAIGFEGDLWLIIHLMIAGRLHWRPPHAKLGGRNNLAAFDFPAGSLVLTEAGSKRRASLHVVRGTDALAAIDPGGIEVFAADLDAFKAALSVENRTLKRALTDPRIVSGIGNAYSDEILHAAQLSPIAAHAQARARRVAAACTTRRGPRSRLWIDRLRDEAGDGFPEHVTAFRKEMAVHGRFGQAVPALRRTGAAHPLRRQRDELLRALSDRRDAARRPQPLAAAESRLAAHARGVGRAQTALSNTVMPGARNSASRRSRTSCRPSRSCRTKT